MTKHIVYIYFSYDPLERARAHALMTLLESVETRPLFMCAVVDARTDKNKYLTVQNNCYTIYYYRCCYVKASGWEESIYRLIVPFCI